MTACYICIFQSILKSISKFSSGVLLTTRRSFNSLQTIKDGQAHEVEEPFFMTYVFALKDAKEL